MSKADANLPCRECPFRKTSGAVRIDPDDAKQLAIDTCAGRIQDCHMGGAPFTGGRVSSCSEYCRGAIEFLENVKVGKKNKRVFSSMEEMISEHAKSNPEERWEYEPWQ